MKETAPPTPGLAALFRQMIKKLFLSITSLRAPQKLSPHRRGLALRRNRVMKAVN
jgi:hypothetical protein